MTGSIGTHYECYTNGDGPYRENRRHYTSKMRENLEGEINDSATAGTGVLQNCT
jgi:hypothetical protein